MNLRLIASRIINDVTNGRSLTERLDATLPSISSLRDRAFVQALCYGVCRYYTRLDVILSYLLQKPMNAKDSDVHALLLVGLYQLSEMRVPPHAAVSETVSATLKLKKNWSKGFVNAILREYLRRESELKNIITEDDEANLLHPIWWIEKIKKAWPNHWETILQANNDHPPFSIRVNAKKLSRDVYLEKLTQANINAAIIPETENGIILQEAINVSDLPGFSTGEVSIQDGAAQLAAELLPLSAGLRILDACCAPGGKLTHILERESNLAALVAVEKDKHRMGTIKENLARLQLKAELIHADAGETEKWWNGKCFDVILLDAPCSASGVVRRHPDIKLLREPNDIKQLTQTQTSLLENLWPLLKSGGTLLYATCSIFPEENSNLLCEFLKNHSDAHEEKLNVTWGIPCEVGQQILPGMHEMDGFYYAKLRKRT